MNCGIVSRTTIRFCGRSLALGLLLSFHLGYSQSAKSEDLPKFELGDFEVTAKQGARPSVPDFKIKSPEFSYFPPADLPNGGMIIALEFMDRYRDATVPGKVKWTGILQFPWVDGLQRPHLQWICLYLYDDVMFGFDPMTRHGDERRFFVPVRYEERTNQDRLFKFAESFVEEISPGGDEFYYQESAVDPNDPSSGTETTLESEYISPGEVLGVVGEDVGADPKSLVHIIYEYREDPNPAFNSKGRWGPAAGATGPLFDWSGLWTYTSFGDHLQTAHTLLAPRWSQRAFLHYAKDILFFKQVRRKVEVLLFNIGTRIFVYHPDYGVWRTNASLQDVERNDLADKISYPGGVTADSVELRPWDQSPQGVAKAPRVN